MCVEAQVCADATQFGQKCAFFFESVGGCGKGDEGAFGEEQ